MQFSVSTAWILLAWASSAAARSPAPYTIEIASIPSGNLKLRGLLHVPDAVSFLEAHLKR